MQNTELRIELESFQGPFDLLLHLIKQMEVDINDIPMTAITSQYIKYIEAMQELELDIIGEYLVMAATLLEIKSNILLPIEPSPDYEEDYEEGDPREILVQQLLLYQQFQTVATQLQIKQDERSRLFTRPMSDLTAYQEFVPLDEGALSLADLTDAMSVVLEKMASREPLEREIQHEAMTVSDQMEKIMAAFNFDTDHESVTLDQFIEYGTRNEIITTFLAMLELVRKQHLVFLQKSKDDPIQMKKLEEHDV